MRQKRVRILIKPLGRIKAEWKLALRGKLHSIQKPGTIIFLNVESAARVFSAARLELFGVIIREKPESIYALSKLVERDFKNVYEDVQALARHGLIELRKTGKRGAIKPVAKYSGIELDLAA
jgi:predicted transcriptional regulator